jgi:hypothetical protein
MGKGQFSQLDSLVVELKSLVAVRDLLRRRGTDVHELDDGIKRVTERLLTTALAVH